MGDLQTNLERLRIGLVAPYEYPYPGGVTEHIFHLDRALRRMGHDVRIIAPCAEDTPIPDHVIPAASRIITIPFAGTKAHISISAKAFPRVKEILERVPFDVMHVQEPLTPTLPLAVLAHSKVVNVGTFHANREVSLVYLYGKPILDRFMDKLDGRIAVSAAARDYVASYFPGDYRVIPNGIDLQRFGDPNVEPVAHFTDGRPNILFVGRLEKRKGFKHLLKAFEIAKREIPDCRLLVVGAYDKQDKEQYVHFTREHGLRDVRFVGYAPPEDLPRWYKTASVFCAPSTGAESFGIILLEAMAGGRPIVASDIEGYRSVLEDGKQGVLVPPEDEEALAAGLIRVLKDPEMAARMGESGRQRAALFSWDSVAQKVAEYYRELIIRRREVQANAE
jgi:phosphatidyl-myo-inositol alpha-mannosyltransferase